MLVGSLGFESFSLTNWCGEQGNSITMTFAKHDNGGPSMKRHIGP